MLGDFKPQEKDEEKVMSDVEDIDGWRPTADLRYIEREHPHGGHDIFLQQLWVKAVRGYGTVSADEKWEDVPTVRGK